MRDFLYRLVERLHDGERPLSRNKHFHTFTGGARQALRIDRHLRDLESRLSELRARGGSPRVHWMPNGGARLVLQDARFAIVRTATLNAEEVALLARHPAGAWALGESAPSTSNTAGAGSDPQQALAALLAKNR